MTTNRGFVSAMAIAMIFLVSAAVITLSIWFTTQARRTQATVAGTQIRQLLLAGIPASLDEIQARGISNRNVTVLTPVDGGQLLLTITKITDTTAMVQVNAELRGKKGAQQLQLEKTGPTWRLSGVHLLYTP
jgi:hypothetical protein